MAAKGVPLCAPSSSHTAARRFRLCTGQTARRIAKGVAAEFQWASPAHRPPSSAMSDPTPSAFPSLKPGTNSRCALQTRVARHRGGMRSGLLRQALSGVVCRRRHQGKPEKDGAQQRQLGSAMLQSGTTRVVMNRPAVRYGYGRTEARSCLQIRPMPTRASSPVSRTLARRSPLLVLSTRHAPLIAYRYITDTSHAMSS